jgi:Uncharacterised protein family UPF0047
MHSPSNGANRIHAADNFRPSLLCSPFEEYVSESRFLARKSRGPDWTHWEPTPPEVNSGLSTRRLKVRSLFGEPIVRLRVAAAEVLASRFRRVFCCWFLGPSPTVPLTEGRPVLGTWQQIMHFECDVRPLSAP